MASGSGWNVWVWLAGGGCGWNLWLWLVVVVLRRYSRTSLIRTSLNRTRRLTEQSSLETHPHRLTH